LRRDQEFFYKIGKSAHYRLCDEAVIDGVGVIIITCCGDCEIVCCVGLPERAGDGCIDWPDRRYLDSKGLVREPTIFAPVCVFANVVDCWVWVILLMVTPVAMQRRTIMSIVNLGVTDLCL